MRRGVRYVIRDGKLIEAHLAPPKISRNYFGRAPTIHCDTIAPRYCDATGKTYESRSELYRDIKDSGSAMTSWDYQAPERGHHSETAEVIEDVKRSYHELKNGNTQYLNEEDLAICKELNGRLRKP